MLSTNNLPAPGAIEWTSSPVTGKGLCVNNIRYITFMPLLLGTKTSLLLIQLISFFGLIRSQNESSHQSLQMSLPDNNKNEIADYQGQPAELSPSLSLLPPIQTSLTHTDLTTIKPHLHNRTGTYTFIYNNYCAALQVHAHIRVPYRHITKK